MLNRSKQGVVWEPRHGAELDRRGSQGDVLEEG